MQCNFMGSVALVDLLAFCSSLRVSSKESFELSSDIREKAAWLAGDGDADFVLRQLASHAQMSKALGQMQLGAPGGAARRLGRPSWRVLPTRGSLELSDALLQHPNLGTGDDLWSAPSPAEDQAGRNTMTAGHIGNRHPQLCGFGQHGEPLPLIRRRATSTCISKRTLI
jgi:hypothetical protein